MDKTKLVSRREFSGYIFSTGFLVAGGNANAKAKYPAKEIKFIVSSTAGAMTDVSARVFAERMSALLKVPVVIENVPGAGSMVASRQVSKAPADGYTLLATANSMVAIPYINSKAGYSVADFTPVGEMARSPSILVVSGKSKYRKLDDLIEDARRRPSQISYASGGIGTTSHLPTELLIKQANIKVEHVPYRSIAQAVPDVIGGRTEFVMGTASSFFVPLKNGDLRALAVTTENRIPQLPDIPTFKELGYGDVTFEIWIGLLAPAGTPQAVVDALAQALEKSRGDQRLRKIFEDAGQFLSDDYTPQKFKAVIDADAVKLKEIVRYAKITNEM